MADDYLNDVVIEDDETSQPGRSDHIPAPRGGRYVRLLRLLSRWFGIHSRLPKDGDPALAALQIRKLRQSGNSSLYELPRNRDRATVKEFCKILLKYAMFVLNFFVCGP